MWYRRRRRGAGKVRIVSHGSDALGRVSQIAALAAGGSVQSIVGAVAYHPFGSVKSWTFDNGSAYARSYDLNGNVAGYNLGTLSRKLAIDAASRIVAYAHNDSAYDQSFGYDNLNRLSTWKASTTNEAYSYDSVHNRTSVTYDLKTYAYAYPAGSNRLASVTGPVAQSYSYDAAGNTTSEGNETYQYDARGRMIQTTSGAQRATYVVNGLGQRVLKTPGTGAATVYLYDKDGQLIAEATTAGAVTREYFYLGRTPVAVATNPTSLYYVYPDHLDTPRVITEAANKIVWRWDNVDPFGVMLPNENPNGAGTFTFNLRLPGQYFDKETELHYNYFRDYDPLTGRYVQSDPIGLAGGVNVFSYVGGALTSFVDPFGLDRQATGPAIVFTDMTRGKTFFYDPITREFAEYATSNAVTKNAKPGAADSYSGYFTYCEYPDSDAYGTAKWRTTDERYRWIHGGGTGLEDPLAPRQGWKPTLGCTRAQNEDVEDLCHRSESWKKKNPGKEISYGRF